MCSCHCQIWVAGSATCDVLIAVCMVYLVCHCQLPFSLLTPSSLRQLLRPSIEMAQTRTVVTKLVRIVIEAGTLTASTALLVLVLYFALPHQAYFTALATVLGKLYSVSLLAVFNSRSKFARNHHWTTEPLYLTFRPPPPVAGVVVVDGIEAVVAPLDGIRVQTEVDVRRDDTSEQAVSISLPGFVETVLMEITYRM